MTVFNEGATRAKVLLTPASEAKCIASIKKTYTNGATLLYPLQFVPSAAEFVDSKVYNILNPKTHIYTAAFISKCKATNIFSIEVESPCGCFYEVRGKELHFVRTLHPMDFKKTMHLPGMVRR